MVTSIKLRGAKPRTRRQSDAGFSLIEVTISMFVLTIGLVSLLGVFGLAMASTQTSQQDMIAKQLADEAMESIVTARNSSQINWDQIQNVANGGIFLNGANPIYKAGADGINGTADDAVAGEQTLQEPGPDGIFGTADDVYIPLTPYQRTILIGPVYNADGSVVATLRAITVSINYSVTQAGIPKTYILNSLISKYQ